MRPTQWLIDAGMKYAAKKVNAFELPFASNTTLKLFKVYSLDSGIVCHMSLSGRQYEVMYGMMDINEGALTENFVTAEFAKKWSPLFYYDKKSRHELDFLPAENDGVHIERLISCFEMINLNSYASFSHNFHLFSVTMEPHCALKQMQIMLKNKL